MIFDSLLNRLGYVRKSELHFARSVGKRLDEHRETVEAIASKTDLFADFWHTGHMATQDDYLMRLYHLTHGVWPNDDVGYGKPQPDTGEFVRPRPKVLGECELPEYPHRAPRPPAWSKPIAT